MTEQDETKELIERIKKLERKLGKIERSSRIGLEDQLFFGIVISLVLFLLSLPLTEVASFFQSVTKFSSDLALDTAEGIRYTGLICLFLASATRYYGAISKVKVSKRFRLLSLECLLMGWNFFLFIFVTNAFFNASLMLGGMDIPLASLFLSFVYALMVLLEKKALSFYASKGLIFKRDIEAFVSKFFLALTFFLYLAFVVEIVATTYMGMPFSSTRFIVVWLGGILLLSTYSSIIKFVKRKIKFSKK